MDNTTVVVVKLGWQLDYLTQSELQGSFELMRRVTVSSDNRKPKVDPKIEKVKGEDVKSDDKTETFVTSQDKNTNQEQNKEEEKSEDKIDDKVEEQPKEEEVTEAALGRARSSSLSFRDSLEGIRNSSGSTLRKSVMGVEIQIQTAVKVTTYLFSFQAENNDPRA